MKISGFLVTILLMSVSSDVANAALNCRALFQSTSLVASRSTVVGPLVSRPLNELMQVSDPKLLSDREKLIVAKAIDYLQRRDPQLGVELIELGAPKEQVVEIMRKVVQKDLATMESEGPTLKLFNDEFSALANAATPFSNRKSKSLKDFSEVYGLDEERMILNGIIGFSFSIKADPANVMKAALITGDRDLVARSFREALKFGNFNELTAMAAHMKNNSALIELGRLSVARYLFFERNHNWLLDGLRSFSEVTGPDRQYVEQVLYDLYDLMRTPEISANESEVRMFSNKSNWFGYSNDALDVLVAALPVAKRLSGDSSARFEYLHERTDDLRFLERFEAHLTDTMARNLNIGMFTKSVIQIRDPKTLIRIAQTAEAYSRKVPKGSDEETQRRFVNGAMSVARNAIAMSADLKEVASYTRRTLADKRFRTMPIGFSIGNESTMIPKKVVELFSSFVQNPKLISESTQESDLNSLKRWFESYQFNMKQQAEQIPAASKTFYRSNFRHEKNVIQYSLDLGKGASEKEIGEFQAAGEQRLAAGAYWEAMGSFIAARDLDGLERTYFLMMTKGRPLDAVYAASAMELIRTGRSPFGNSAIEVQNEASTRALGR